MEVCQFAIDFGIRSSRLAIADDVLCANKCLTVEIYSTSDSQRAHGATQFLIFQTSAFMLYCTFLFFLVLSYGNVLL